MSMWRVYTSPSGSAKAGLACFSPFPFRGGIGNTPRQYGEQAPLEGSCHAATERWRSQKQSLLGYLGFFTGFFFAPAFAESAGAAAGLRVIFFFFLSLSGCLNDNQSTPFFVFVFSCCPAPGRVLRVISPFWGACFGQSRQGQGH